MDVDMRNLFDYSDMRLERFEEYMFHEPSGQMSFYGGEEHNRGEPWEEIAGANGWVVDRGPFYPACSPSHSRSSSLVSGKESESSLSLENPCTPESRRIFNGPLTGLCSSLSELAQSSSSSLQSIESDVDDSHGISMSDSNPCVSSQAPLPMSSDLGSLMESILGSRGMISDFSAVDGGSDHWSNLASGACSDSGDAKLFSRSSPVSPFDFGDEERSPPQVAPEHDEVEADGLQGPGSYDDFSHMIDGGNQSFSQDHLQLLRSNKQHSEDSPLFYQHFLSQIPFQNCHTLESSGFQPHAVPHLGIKSEDDLNGVRLVHLLLAGAEAVASSNVDLASVILVRLKELASRNGTTMQRVAAYFSEGLQCRMEGFKGPEKAFELQNDSLSAFHVLHEVTPYIKFGHFAANQAILEAFEGERRVHIMDYDILEGIQWPSLMQALACRPGGPPHLRITALCRPHVKRSLATTQETGKRLAEFAASFNIPFTFHQVRIDNEDEFRPTLLKQVKGECLAVNCMVHLPHMPHRSKKAVASFLRAIHRLSPKVLTLVEEELSSSTPTFVSHFFEALHHYSAIFDSLEATLSAESRGLHLVERIFLAPRISSFMTSSNSEGPGVITDATGSIHWHALAEAAGFHPVPLTVYNLCQAKLLVGLFNDGFKVDDDSGRLLLSWRSKFLLGASVWQCT